MSLRYYQYLQMVKITFEWQVTMHQEAFACYLPTSLTSVGILIALIPPCLDNLDEITWIVDKTF